MRHVGTVNSRFVVAACAMLMLPLLAGCANFSDPVTSDVLAKLPPQDAKNLQQWSTNHSVIFDARLHSMRTCPFLTYMPAYTFVRGDTQKWAEWLLEFYQAKHEEEDNCTCSSS